MKKTLKIKDILILQAVIIVYTLSSVMAKLASGQEPFSVRFCLFYLAELFVLGLYALLWQQMIKKFDLSVAYANRAMALLWSLVWSVIFFHDQVTVKNVIGVVLVIIGTFIVNGETEASDSEGGAANE